ncbi:protein canopy homolog 2 isoform X1 [Parus major]|uniref:protein canopy homolog 2 isoform X1 n=2 Tax=Parus major TaxID=9157 RepID=UPI0008F54C12|nr:protein canopy homolog 2 isoform X1 [Parus major]
MRLAPGARQEGPRLGPGLRPEQGGTDPVPVSVRSRTRSRFAPGLGSGFRPGTGRDGPGSGLGSLPDPVSDRSRSRSRIAPGLGSLPVPVSVRSRSRSRIDPGPGLGSLPVSGRSRSRSRIAPGVGSLPVPVSDRSRSRIAPGPGTRLSRGGGVARSAQRAESRQAPPSRGRAPRGRALAAAGPSAPVPGCPRCRLLAGRPRRGPRSRPCRSDRSDRLLRPARLGRRPLRAAVPRGGDSGALRMRDRIPGICGALRMRGRIPGICGALRMRGHILALLGLALALASLLPTAGARRSQDLHCGACRALVDELEWEIAQVDPRKTIQMGSFRINPDGSQSVVEVPYARSEAHLTELLERVCEKMKEYGEKVDPATHRKSYVRVISHDGTKMDLSGVKFDGDVTSSLKFACESIAEEYEDELIEFLSHEAENVKDRLCSKRTDLCDHALHIPHDEL